ncbi:Protein CL16A [Coemansia sp. RSA 1646]|nr:Protein CL16A [Coemansia sp. RSA 1646]
MFNFLNLFALSSEQKDAQDPADQKRAQIHQLAAYLSTVKVKRSAIKKIVESLRQVAEVIVWCDRRHNPELLSLTLEVGLHRAMLRFLYFGQRLPKTNAQQRRNKSSAGQKKQHTGGGILPADSKEGLTAVVTQTLQTFSIILDGVTDHKYMYLLFSNNFVNDLIAAPVVGELDSEEVLAYYVAFLKALSLRLTSDTIHFFFNKTGSHVDDFPLYTTAIGLFNHADSMVRVAVRAITLNVLRIGDRDAVEFILNGPGCAHFWEQVVCALRDSCDDAFRILVDMPEDSGGSDWASVDLVLEKHMGLLAYLNDIYGLAIERISAKITDEFVDRIIQRTYVHAVEIGWRPSATAEEALYMQVVSLFIAHFFAIVKHSPLLADAMNALFVLPSDEADDETLPVSHLFVPSPLEPSRTLAPWACIALEVLSNKAISPSTLVKSVLTPRRMLRTRALLDSLTGDCNSDSNSNGSQSPPLGNQRQLSSTAVASMVHVLIDDSHMHSWITVDLAALLLSELCKSPNGTVLIEGQELVSKLVDARNSHSTELRLMLLSMGSGLWKTMVKCLIDFANSTPDTLRIKAQAEGKHIFSNTQLSERPEKQQRPVSPFESPPEQRCCTDRAFEAMVHQVYNIKWICSSFGNQSPPLQRTPDDETTGSQKLKNGSYARDLHAWISGGDHMSNWEDVYSSGFESVVIDNAAKNALPRSVSKLGFTARIACHDGCLLIWQNQSNEEENRQPDLVWPLADVAITETTLKTDACELPALCLTDTPFPQPFFPARPQSLGGISISASFIGPSSARFRKSLARSSSKLYQYSYVGKQRALDISLRFMDDLECADAEGLLQKHAQVSRQLLSEILFKHNVI